MKNTYYEYLTDLVEDDGSYKVVRENGGSTTGYDSIEISIQMALLVELRLLREELGALGGAL